MSLGNVGSAQSICIAQFINFNQNRTLKCEKGRIGKLISLGAHTGNSAAVLTKEAGRYEKYLVGNAFCGNRTHINEAGQCSQLIDKKRFVKDFTETCIGKKSCSFGMVNPSYIKTVEEANKKMKVPRGCTEETAQVYIQAICEFDTSEKRAAQYVGVTAILICVFMAALYTECVKHREGLTDLEFTKWDLQTTTANDYSVRLNIPDEWYQAFLKKQQKREK